jgi:hypothetical protein
MIRLRGSSGRSRAMKAEEVALKKIVRLLKLSADVGNRHLPTTLAEGSGNVFAKTALAQLNAQAEMIIDRGSIPNPQPNPQIQQSCVSYA